VLLPRKAGAVPSQKTQANLLLRSLSPGDWARLQPHLEEVALALRDRLEEPNVAIANVFFPLSGIASVVVRAPEYSIEVGIIGHEGMTGISVLLGADRSPHDCFVQVAGSALRIPVRDLQAAFADRPGLRVGLLPYAREFMLQTAQTALANGRCTIEERLARWLLMAQDRIDGDDVPFTHEFLSLMLGVRRPGVTIALQTLEGAGLIRNTRSLVTILDRAELEATAGGAYAPRPSANGRT
jgi:CRP-like cAMP-binding protein